MSAITRDRPRSRRQFLTYLSAVSGVVMLSACAAPTLVVQPQTTAHNGPQNEQGETNMNTQSNNGAVKNIVLVHGGFVDGSGWEGVYKKLTQDGYTVSV